MAGGKQRAVLTCTLLLTSLLGEAFISQGLLPACGPVENLLTPCYSNITGGLGSQPMSPASECCKSIKRFRFPGCMCVALVEQIGRTIDERMAVAALSLPASCGRPLPTGFNCTGFSH